MISLRGCMRRAMADTMQHFGPSKELAASFLIFVLTSGVSLTRKGSAEMAAIIEAAISGAIAVAICWFLLFCFNLAAAPFRLERERADAAEAKLAKLAVAETAVPSAQLEAMSRYERTLVQRDAQLAMTAKIVRQRNWLMEHAHATMARRPDMLSAAKLEIDELILDILAQIAVPLPPEPRRTLRIPIGWNEQFEVFHVVMAAPPNVQFDGLPAGATAEVKSTRLSFRVKFWPDSVVVSDYEATMSAEL